MLRWDCGTMLFFINDFHKSKFGKRIMTYRLISLAVLVLCLPMYAGCKMCANADIYGSPVAGSSSGNYHRAGSLYGGYGGNGYSGDFGGTAQAKHVYDSEITPSQQSITTGTGTNSGKNSPTLAPPRTQKTTTYNDNNYVVPATPMPQQYSAQKLLQEQNGATDIRILSVQDSAVSN